MDINNDKYTFHYLQPEGMWAVYRETSSGGMIYIDSFLTEGEAAAYCERMNNDS